MQQDYQLTHRKVGVRAKARLKVDELAALVDEGSRELQAAISGSSGMCRPAHSNCSGVMRELQRWWMRSREAKAEADSANRAKSRFWLQMSHEIHADERRAGHRGTAAGGLSDKRRHSHTIRDSGIALLHVINEILDFSRSRPIRWT